MEITRKIIFWDKIDNPYRKDHILGLKMTYFDFTPLTLFLGYRGGKSGQNAIFSNFDSILPKKLSLQSEINKPIEFSTKKSLK